MDDENDMLKNEVTFRDALLLAKHQGAVKMPKRPKMLEKQSKPPSPCPSRTPVPAPEPEGGHVLYY